MNTDLHFSAGFMGFAIGVDETWCRTFDDETSTAEAECIGAVVDGTEEQS